MQLELRNHPAQARFHNPKTGQKEPLVNEDGTPVPLFPKSRAIYLNDVMVGYCEAKAGTCVQLVRHVEDSVRDKIQKFVDGKFGEVGRVTMPPEPPEQTEDETDTEFDGEQ